LRNLTTEIVKRVRNNKQLKKFDLYVEIVFNKLKHHARVHTLKKTFRQKTY